MGEKRRQFLREKLYDLYTLLYKEATPSADFRTLVANAPWIKRNDHPKKYFNMSKEEQVEFDKTFVKETIIPADSMTTEEAQLGGFKKKIDFDAYYLDEVTYNAIVENFIKDRNNKLTSLEKRGFKVEAYLGCGPTSSEENWRKHRKELGLDDMPIS